MGKNFLLDRIRKYLNERGISDEIIERNHISWDGEKIVIPVFDKTGIWLFNKYRRDPEVSEGPKYTYDKGATTAIYGIDKIKNAASVIICEGEFDSLILEAQGFTAVSSTGGAGSFKEEWAAEFVGKDLYVCMDNDAAGDQGRLKVTAVIPSIKSIPLPPEVGEHGDVTDFFIKLGKTKKDFSILMQVATPLPLPAPQRKRAPKKFRRGDDTRLQAAKAVSLDRFLKFNQQNFARCPFHNEKTPSLHWFGDNRWHCFGCGEGGDVVDFILKRDNCSMAEAIDTLLKL